MGKRKRPNGQVRMEAETRRRQLVESASELLLRREVLPLSLVELGRRAGVSKSLIYAYFPTQRSLFNAILARQFESLHEAGLTRAISARTLSAAAAASADLYFSHVAEFGPVIHIVLRDQYMSGHLDPVVIGARDRTARTLVRLGMKSLKLTAKEAVAAFHLIATIPEEAGRLAFQGEMKRESARKLCGALVESALKAIAPALR